MNLFNCWEDLDFKKKRFGHIKHDEKELYAVGKKRPSTSAEQDGGTMRYIELLILDSHCLAVR